ncbi:hypothetical protein [Pedobacter sp. L105]|uniref:hypothetical protein n=1 Tax=Pedobacter sp. L105 TaxID=1641871 RepID=UPI00131E7C9E|nr:hypothetical protein [Pedobacter sp. L105]
MELSKAVGLLRMISIEIDEFFNTNNFVVTARSTDIYDAIRKNEALRSEFPTGKEFNSFLRKMHQEGVLNQIIRNHIVDISNPIYYKWSFYRKESKMPTELNSESVKIAPKYYKSDRKIATNDGGSVRSYQEQYIYNRLLEEDGLKFYYERPFEIKGYNKIPDFTILALHSKIVYHWEHFGMMDNPSYGIYVEKKIQWYIDRGYDFIENNGRFIVTYYKNDTAFYSDVKRIVKLIKAF